eukprot:gene15134-20373_t
MASKGYFDLPNVPKVERFDDYVETLPPEIEQEGRIGGSDVAVLLRKRMRYQIQNAFDNLYPEDIDEIMESVWESNLPNIVQIRLKLMELSSYAEKIEDTFSRRDGSYGNEDLADEIRVVRSKIRMYCGDSELSYNKRNQASNPINKGINAIKAFFVNKLSKKNQ